MTETTSVWLGRFGIAVGLTLCPDLVLANDCGSLQGCWDTAGSAATASVSAAVIVAAAIASCFARNVYDELSRDIHERTSANEWEALPSSLALLDAVAGEDGGGASEHSPRDVAGDATGAMAVVTGVLSPDSRGVDGTSQRAEVTRDQTRASEPATARPETDRERAAAVCEARAAAEVEVVRVRTEADQRLVAALKEAHAEAERRRQMTIHDAEAAAEAEIARVDARISRLRSSLLNRGTSREATWQRFLRRP